MDNDDYGGKSDNESQYDKRKTRWVDRKSNSRERPESNDRDNAKHRSFDQDQREIFPFRIFIKDEYLREGIASKSEREVIIKETSIDNILMDHTIQVPDVPGQAMIIESSDL